MDKKDLKIIFFGTPEFAVASLDKLVADGYNISAVVTMPDKIGGRGHKVIESDVKKYAVAHNLRVLQPEKLKSLDFVNALREINADLFIVIAFRMLPEVVWQMPPLGTFNLHASLLPKYRGAAPINRALMNGETETGITTFFLKHEIDTGDIIEQRATEISDADNAGSLHDRLMEMGAEMVESTVRKILDGTLSTQSQPKGDFTPAPKIFKTDCEINWNSSSTNIFNHIRGLSPYPGAFTNMVLDSGKEVEMKIFSAKKAENRQLHTDSSTYEIGKVITSDGKLFVTDADGAIEVLQLQIAGKRRMTADEFLRGYKPIMCKTSPE